jgi:hypothetical protein
MVIVPPSRRDSGETHLAAADTGVSILLLQFQLMHHAAACQAGA